MDERIFKTIYFPRDRVYAGSSARVTISIPSVETDDRLSPQFVNHLRSVSSRELRLALGDPFLEDLEKLAVERDKSLSDVCLDILVAHEERATGAIPLQSIQLAFPGLDAGPADSRPSSRDVGVNFRESRRQGVHGWYPYVEGFSATYVRDVLLRFRPLPRSVYDPFGGAGTISLSASLLGIRSFYSEINPFMAFVTETKVSAARWARDNFSVANALTQQFLDLLTEAELDEAGKSVDTRSYEAAFPNRNYFEDRHLRHLLAALDIADLLTQEWPEMRAIFRLACAANAVHSSNMTRRADLRRRRADEYKTRQVDVASLISSSLRRMIEDLERLPVALAPTTMVSEDCRGIPAEYKGAFEAVITSPPYLNGTNYFRNTKIELWLLGLLANEQELAAYHGSAIAAGINSVRSRGDVREFGYVEAVATRLDGVAGDRRIPLLVRQYFSDMADVFEAVHNSMSSDGRFFLDIGDSKFYGVHVPTDQLLIEIGREIGLELSSRSLLARRYSRDRTDLVQVELVFRKTSVRPSAPSGQPPQDLVTRIDAFERRLPYKDAPYSARNWGNGLHSLCSYQGKLKPGLSHWLVRQFTDPTDVVLDPLGGVGTIGFEAALQGRQAISNDKSPFASLVARAKLDPPTLAEAEHALERIAAAMDRIELGDLDREAAKFGLNGSVADYYHPRTLDEVLRARHVLLNSVWPMDRGEAFVWASVLHVLHGNRPYALSRTSHPITPFHPSGPAEYKSLVGKVGERINRALSLPLPTGFRPGLGLRGDFVELPEKVPQAVDVVITSPPFLGMRFDRPNWLRLWFCGWLANDFHIQSLGFLERQQIRSTECYRDVFEVCATLF